MIKSRHALLEFMIGLKEQSLSELEKYHQQQRLPSPPGVSRQELAPHHQTALALLPALADIRAYWNIQIAGSKCVGLYYATYALAITECLRVCTRLFGLTQSTFLEFPCASLAHAAVV
jgi:hypothetical protein